MNTFERAAGFSMPRLGKQIFASLSSLALLFATLPQNLSANQSAQTSTQLPPQANQTPSTASAPPYAQQTPEQLQQLVAPIALYPDSLVAQILAASTFPEQVVEANRWVTGKSKLEG